MYRTFFHRMPRHAGFLFYIKNESSHISTRMLIPITSNQAGQCFEMDFSESVAGFRKFNQFLRLRDGIQQVTVSKTLTKFYCPLSSLALHALSSRGSSPSDMRQRFPIRTTMATVLKATKACEFQIRMTSTNQFISSFD